MEELLVSIVPSIYEWAGTYVTAVFGFFGAGILIAFILWTIPFAIDTAFTWLRREAGL